jgi:hypothetical protein
MTSVNTDKMMEHDHILMVKGMLNESVETVGDVLRFGGMVTTPWFEEMTDPDVRLVDLNTDNVGRVALLLQRGDGPVSQRFIGTVRREEEM